MAMFYSPKLTKRPKQKVMSQTAYRKAMRRLTALSKDIRYTDAVLADALLATVTAFEKLDKLEN